MSDSPNLCMLPVAALPPSDAEGPALGLLPFGVQAVDVWLNGGLRRGGVHEFYAAPDGERSAATALALLLGFVLPAILRRSRAAQAASGPDVRTRRSTARRRR